MVVCVGDVRMDNNNILLIDIDNIIHYFNCKYLELYESKIIIYIIMMINIKCTKLVSRLGNLYIIYYIFIYYIYIYI